MLQLVGFVICLHSAAKITHMAQRIVSVVSQWHALESCTEEVLEGELEQDNTKQVITAVSSPPINGESMGNSSQHVDPFVQDRASLLEQFMAITNGDAPQSVNVDEIGDIDARLNLFQSTSMKRHSSNEIHSFPKRHALGMSKLNVTPGSLVFNLNNSSSCE